METQFIHSEAHALAEHTYPELVDLVHERVQVECIPPNRPSAQDNLYASTEFRPQKAIKQSALRGCDAHGIATRAVLTQAKVAPRIDAKPSHRPTEDTPYKATTHEW